MRKRHICVFMLSVLLSITGCTASDLNEESIENEIRDTSEVDAQDLVVEEADKEVAETIYVELQGVKYNLTEAFESKGMDILSKEELAYLRNAVYAKHGYVFKNKKYTDFFSQYDWYRENENLEEVNLSDLDITNVNLVKEYEAFVEVSFEKSADIAFTNNLVVSNGKLKLTTEKMENYEGGNKPTRVIMSIDGDETIYESTWNDGIFALIVDFDKKDDFIDVYIIDTNTDISSTTLVYRFDGEKIVEYGSFDHFDGNFLFDGEGKIYYWGSDPEDRAFNCYYDYKLNETHKIKSDSLKSRLEEM